MALGIVIQDREGNITAANPAAERILGLPRDHLIGIGSLNYDWQTVKLNGEVLPGTGHPAVVALRTGRRVDDFILGLFNPKKNSRKWLSVSAVPDFRKGEAEAFQVITTFTDITDRIRVQHAFEERVKELRCLTDISGILQKNPSLPEVCEKVVWGLVSAIKYSEFAFAEIQMAGVEKTTHPDGQIGINDLIVPIFSTGEKLGQIRVGYFKDLPFILPEEKDLLESVADSLSLWYERKTIRQHLEESELRFRRAVMNMPTPVMIHAEDGEIITLNDSWVEISGYSREELPTLSDWIAKAYGESDDSVRSVIARLFALEGPLDEGEFTIRTRGGEQRVWEFRSAPLGRLPDGRKSVISMGMDTTKRKQAEQERERFYERIRALREIDKLIMSSLDMEEVLGRVTSELSRVMQYDSMSVMLFDNGTLEIIAGQGFVNPEEIIGLRFPNEPEYPNYDVIQGVQPVTSTQISKDYPKFTQPLREDLSIRVQSWLGVPLISQDGVIGMFAIDRFERKAFTEEDIQIAMEFANRAAIAIHNAQLYERTGEQLEKLSVLRNIDSAITTSLNLEEALPILLRQIKVGLAVDAAAVLLYDDVQGGLRFKAGIGFKNQPEADRVIPLGQGYAGNVARDGEPVFVAETDYHEGGSAYPVNLAKEGVVSFCALPMIAKGKLMGVLELFHRERLVLDENWKAFAETLTRQAAIAVDNISLFTDLEQANQNLKQAYDATIQGWAKALELRDQETEGHSQRVVALTLALAKHFGFEGEALSDIRRGVLLHDIGKMAIPDAILRKPGPLTEAEWEVMRQHPVYAYNMLKGIDYLEAALQIPHYHHERWNGAGYPEGLSREDIPLEARIFAVVDVWDALNSDRPYRDAWPRQEVIAYLQKQSGKEFDPAVVDAFMVLIGEGE
jgi:PAS domain S-box-containing protein